MDVHRRADGALSDVPALALRGVGKRFGHVRALVDATLVVAPGSVHALLGENGAGKTTLMRIAYGEIAPDRGTVAVRGTQVRLATPGDAIAAGIGMVHQHFALVPAMTVAENVALGGAGRFDAPRAAVRVREIAEATGLAVDPRARIAELGVGARQRVEIIKALAHAATILILDEPTAVLAPAEAADLLRWMREFADGGGTVVLITHKLREAQQVADATTVLRAGRTVLTTDEAPAPEAQVLAAIVGSAGRALATEHVAPSRGTPGPVVARADRLTIRDARGVVRVDQATLELRAGEIVGIAAVEGSGQHELLRALAGRQAIAGGAIERPARTGFVPEDRLHEALVPDFSLAENVALRGAGSADGLLHWRAIRAQTAALMERYDVRAPGPRALARTLSGGNQQKLVLARELDGHSPMLVVENPTRGLDVRATAAVHERLRAVAAAGTAVVLYSSDLDEVLALATRVLVMHAGRLREVPDDRDAVGRAMLGAAGASVADRIEPTAPPPAPSE